MCSNRWSNAKIAQWIIMSQIVFVLFERILIQHGMPGAIIYVMDILNVLLFTMLLLEKKNNFVALTSLYGMMILLSAIVGICNYSAYKGNLLFTAIETRNLIRFPVFFMACAEFLNERTIEKLFKILEAHFWVNSFFITVQYFTFPPDSGNMRGDLLNGFFGTMRGGNAFVNIEMALVLFWCFTRWREKKKKFWELTLTLVVAVLVAGMIELKAFYFEIAGLYGMYLLCCKKTKTEWKYNAVFLIVFAIISVVSVEIMLMEYPWFKEVMSLQGMLKAVRQEHYSNEIDLNRFTGFSVIARDIFKGDFLKILFGIGFGNGATYSVVGTKTLFAQQYAATNYVWFQGLYMFVQSGLTGMMLYGSTFLWLLFARNKTRNYRLLSNGTVILTVFLVFYCDALRMDAGYLVYMAIAAGFVQGRRKKSDVAFGDCSDL